jgi:hypothetical protein
MEVQIKSFQMPVTGVYVIITTHGLIDTAAFKQMFHKIASLTQPRLGCKTLIDLQYVWGTLETADIDTVANELPPDLWPPTNKVALISAPESDQYEQLFVLRTAISNHGFKVGLFPDPKDAINWLLDTF